MSSEELLNKKLNGLKELILMEAEHERAKIIEMAKREAEAVE
ncbi:MAG: H+transporting two-sector ATPase E subunit, partial [Thermovirga lienii]